MTDDWRADAACTRTGPELFFPVLGEAEGQVRIAKWVCRRACPVRDECLADALRHEAGKHAHDRHGIWGGLTPSERARLDPGRRRPAVEPAGCPWPHTTRGLERHAGKDEQPCEPCYQLEVRTNGLRRRDERILRMRAGGASPWGIALAMAMDKSNVRRILARHDAAPVDRFESDSFDLVSNGEIVLGD